MLSLAKLKDNLIKNLAAKLLLASVLTFGVQEANANLYKINLTYSSDRNSGDGSVSGFIIIDSSQYDTAQNNTDLGPAAEITPLPAWIQSASLTLTGRTGDEAIYNGTTTSFNTVAWALRSTTRSSDTPITAFDPFDFYEQMGRFSLANPTESINLSGGNLIFGVDQQIGGGEFRLLAASTEAVPGPLPILAIGPLAYYYRKFKKKSANS